MSKNMKTIDIKGKPYIEVNERIKEFRSNQLYKGYSLESDIIQLENGICTIKAIIKDETGRIIATGYAQEKENSSFINKTSYIENCETSAWGRALGNLGIGIDTSIASADEVLNAMANQLPKSVNKSAADELFPPDDSVNSDDDLISGLDGCADIVNLNLYFNQHKAQAKDGRAFLLAYSNRKRALNGN